MELPTRDITEAEFRDKLKTLSAKHRRELKTLLGIPANPENVPAEFWDRVEQENRDYLAVLIMAVFADSARSHGLNDTSATALSADYALRRADKIARDYAQNTRNRVWNLSESTNGELLEKIGEGLSKTELERLARQNREKILDESFNDDRFDGMAATETTAAQTAGSEKSATVGGKRDDEDTWFTREDQKVCPVCAPLHGEPRSVWSRQFPNGPPAHPNCRCWIHYADEKGDIRSVR